MALMKDLNEDGAADRNPFDNLSGDLLPGCHRSY